MKAIILCAGYGKRLRPLTDNTPKPMVKVLSIPILEYTLTFLYTNSISEVFINRHHMPHKFNELKIPHGMRLTFSDEKEILGTAGGILSFEDKVNDDDFLVVNGDIIFSLDISKMLSLHRESGNLATMALRKKDIQGVSPVYVDDFSNVVHIGTGNPDKILSVYREYMFTGIHILSPVVFKYINRTSAPSCIVREFYIPNIERKHSAYIMEDKDLWCEFGDLSSYIKNSARILKLLTEYKIDEIYEMMISTYWDNAEKGKKISMAVEGIWLGDDTYIDSQATIYPPVFIGRKSKLQKGSRVGPYCILGDDVEIAENTELRTVIVDNGIYIDKDLDIRDSLITSTLNYKINKEN